MTTIIYRKSKFGYVCRALICDGAGEISIKIDGCRDGEISLSGERAKIEDGAAKFNTPPCLDAIIEPMLHKGGTSVPLERIRITGGIAYTVPSFGEACLELSELIGECERELADAEARLDRLESAVFENNLF